MGRRITINRPLVVAIVVVAMLLWAAFVNAHAQQTYGGDGAPWVMSSQLTSNVAGSAVWTYPPPCTQNSRFWAQPVVSTSNQLVNVQNVGLPTSTSQTFQVNVTNFSVVSLIGLTILSVPSSPGATVINVFCE